MAEGRRGPAVGLWPGLVEAASGLAVAGWVWWLWPRLGLPVLGAERWWFGLGWLIMLAGPAGLRLMGVSPRGRLAADAVSPAMCAWGAHLCGWLFGALLYFGALLGNYKLWLGLVYLCGLGLRLGGLSLGLRAELRQGAKRPWLTGLAGAGLALMSCLLCLAWVRPDLAAQWPPDPWLAWRPALAALLWALTCGAALVLLPALPRGRRLGWLIYLALSVGALPALAVAWFRLSTLAALAGCAVGLAFAWRLRARRRGPSLPSPDNPLPVYWLLRALLVLWWAAGLAVSLAVAWWRPDVGALLLEAEWLRALALGAFLVICLGLLAEYALPLMGQEGWLELTRRSRALSLCLSALALAAALAPLMLYQWPKPREAPPRPLTRLELLEKPVVLSPDNPELKLTAPEWLSGVSRLHVFGHLLAAEAADQGAPVVQLVATDEQDVPYIFLLRAGVDIADRELDKRDAADAKHQMARVARSWWVFTPTGEAYQAHDYYTGLYLGRRVGGLAQARLRYIYKNPPGQPPLKVLIRRVAVE